MRRFDVSGLALDAYLLAARIGLPLALRSLAIDSVLRGLEATTPRSSTERARLALARSEALAARLGVPGTCLYRAMARWAALRGAGLDASFVMGVRRAGGDLGHAWVEVNGVPVDEAPDGDLVVTYRFPPGTRPPSRSASRAGASEGAPPSGAHVVPPRERDQVEVTPEAPDAEPPENRVTRATERFFRS